MFVRAHQVIVNKRFDDDQWRNAIAEVGGLPILKIETDFVEEYSPVSEEYIVQWNYTQVNARSTDELSKADYGEKVINRINAIQLITPQLSVLKSIDRPTTLDGSYWSIERNDDGALLKKSSLDTPIKFLFHESMNGDINPANIPNWVIETDSANSEIIATGKAGDKVAIKKTYMAQHPEKLKTVEFFDFMGKVERFLEVEYSGLNPVKITKYTFYNASVDPDKTSDRSFLLAHCHTYYETTILEYEEGYSQSKFGADPLGEIQEGDAVSDKITGYYEVVGKEGSRVKIADLPVYGEAKQQ